MIHLEINNYRRFRSVSLDFPDGITGILGPNGAGKSTLIEAVAWAMYGAGGKNSDITRDGKDGIRSYNASPKDECSVRLIFELGGVTYDLFRSLKGKNNTPNAQLSGNGIAIASGDSAVTEKIEMLTGMKSREFFISIFSKQKDLAALSDTVPAKRKEHIMNLLNIAMLQDAADNVSADINSEKKFKNALEASMRMADGRLKRDHVSDEAERLSAEKKKIAEEFAAAQKLESAGLQEKLQLISEKEALEASRNEFLKVKNRIDAKENELVQNEKHKADVERDITLLEERKTQLSELKNKHHEYESLLNVKEELEKCRQLFVKRTDQVKRINKCSADIRRNSSEEEIIIKDLECYSGISSELEKITENVSETSDNISKLEQTASSCGTKLSSAEERLKLVEDRIKTMQERGPDSVCPECERTLGEHHKTLLEKLLLDKNECTLEIQKLTEEYDACRKEIHNLKGCLQTLNSRKKSLEADKDKGTALASQHTGIKKRIKELETEKEALLLELESMESADFDEAAYNRTLSEIKNLKASSEEYISLNGRLMNLPDFVQKRDKLAGDIVKNKEELAALSEELEKTAYDEAQYIAARGALKNAEQMYEAAGKAASQKEKELAVIEEKIRGCISALEDIKKSESEAEKSSKKIFELETLKTIFTGLKESMMERMIPALSETASSLFNSMTDGRYSGLELDDNYNILVNDNDGTYPIVRFSGGETDLANLCLRLAISRMLSERSGRDINLLVLDEIFGSQDQNRKRNIMSALSSLEKQFSQILLITHIDDVKDLMSNVIVVKDVDSGESTAELLDA